MRQPLKDKIQNAINHALFLDGDQGALIVGGRRRNRKKKNKNKNNKNKKQQKKQEGKSKKLVPEQRENLELDERPLIDNEAEEDDKTDNQKEEDSSSQVITSDDKENEMPFDLFKKKSKEATAAAEKPAEDKPDAGATPQEKVEQSAVPPAAVQAEVPVAQQQQQQPEQIPTKEPDADGGTDAVKEKANGTAQDQGDATAAEKTEVADGEMKQMEIKESRSENSPLIDKESKMKDAQPGFLCCTII